MTDINSNQHGSLLFKGLWELELEQIAANLAVDLTQNVGRFGQVKRPAVPHRDHLRRHLIRLEDFFEHRVVGLEAEHSDADHWVSEDTSLRINHILSELVLQLVFVVLVVKLDPVGLLDIKLKLLASIAHRFVDVVSDLVI